MDWKETNRSKSCKYQGRLCQSHKGFFGFGITFMEPLSASAASGWRVHIRHLPKATESPGAFLSAHSIPWKSWKAIKTRKYHKTNKTSILWSKTCFTISPFPALGVPHSCLWRPTLLQRVLLQVMFTWGTKPLEVSIPDLAVDPTSSDGLRYQQIPAKAIGILPFEVFGGYVISKSTLPSWPSNKSQDRLCPKIIAGARNSLVNLSWIAEVSPSLIKSLLTWRQALKSSYRCYITWYHQVFPQTLRRHETKLFLQQFLDGPYSTQEWR